MNFFLFRWFQGFHWQGLLERTLEPPIKPKVLDMTYGALLLTVRIKSHWVVICDCCIVNRTKTK